MAEQQQLVCPACSFSNEPERVYCHNCGAKLDRSLLPKVETDKDSDTVEAARRRIKKMTKPKGYGFGEFLKSLVTTLFWAAVVSSVYLISQKPEGVPEEKNELPDRLIQSELMEATQSPTSRTLAFTEADANGALKQALRRAPNSGGFVEFQRAAVRFFPGQVRIYVQQALWGYPVYSSVDYRLTIAEGKLRPDLLGGGLGRLPVHPAVMKYLDFAFQKLWAALTRERTQMEHLQMIDVRAGQIVLVSRPAI